MEVEEIINTINSQSGLKIKDFSLLHRKETIASNKIYLLTSESNDKYILKIYYKDERNRLQREWGGCSFYHELKYDYTATPIYVNLDGYFAIYSFLQGTHKLPKDADKNDMKKIADFIIFTQLNSHKSQDMGYKFDAVVGPAFSPQETIEKIRAKSGKFLSDTEIDKYEIVKNFKNKYNIPQLLDSLINKAVKDHDLNVIQTKVEPSKMILSVGDLHFSNVLFHNNEAYFIDLEDFGWDDPVSLISWFLLHDKSRGLNRDNKVYFVNYLINSKVYNNDYFRKRLKAALDLGVLLWLSVYLLAMTSERIKTSKFANPNLDIETYLKEKINRFEERLSELDELKNYPLL